MEKPSFRSSVLLIIPALILTAGCAASDGRRVARTTPQKEPVAMPVGSAQKAPLPKITDPAGAAASEDPVELILARAQEEYDQGVEALKAGDSEGARDRFDAAVQIFMNSVTPVDQNPRLKAAYNKMVDDIASLESDLEETPSSVPDAAPSPTEKLKDITTYLTPEESQREFEKVAPEAIEISFDIPMVLNDKVLAWVEIFRNRKEFRASFIGGYERYGWYEDMIHKTLKEEGLPSDLIFMAFLESTYKTSAYSRARAKGIWQFMTPTGRQYGLKVDRYVDERSHPEKSTRSAARYMKDLYATFGDWHLAIAAYNTGAGNIMRAQRRSGRTSYWDLAQTRYMRTETKNFVPAILALALISKDPAKYGFKGIEHNPPLKFDRVTVDGPTDLSLVARLAGCSLTDIKFLNPHLRLGVTPPGENEYEVLVPDGTGEEFLTAYQAMPKQERLARLAKVHTVRRGETLGMIAARYGTTVEELKATNNIRNVRLIRVGKQITVSGGSGGAAWDDDSRPRSGSSRAARSGSKYSPHHIVRRGETLSGISRAYGVSLKNLLDWNGMTAQSIIKPGKKLVVSRAASSQGNSRPTGASHTGAPGAPAASLVSVPGGGQASADPTGEKIRYRVRSGDNLFRIALKYQTTVDSLKAWNNLAGDAIRVGDMLTIYPN